eukprot:791291-Rhodomonas_salina.1
MDLGTRCVNPGHCIARAQADRFLPHALFERWACTRSFHSALRPEAVCQSRTRRSAMRPSLIRTGIIA